MAEGKKAFGWAARDTSGIFSPFSFTLRATEEYDVRIKILYCGICHGDLHLARQDIDFPITYPFVPGHEIVGEVIEIGDKVEKFKPKDRAGVGCFVRSCGGCEYCEQGMENYCQKAVMTVAGRDHDCSRIYGGFSDAIVVHERYVFRISENLPLHSTAPLLCAGISVYSPMRYFGLDRPGVHVGVVGLGGLGHMGVKFAKALGLTVTVISTSPHKEREAVQVLGADNFLLSTDENMKGAVGSLDGIIDTVSGAHPIAPLIDLLKINGKLVLIGASTELLQVNLLSLMRGMKETQEMLDFAAEHNITADVEVISMDYVNTAMNRLKRGDVKYRFVIDVANTLKMN